jgi:hypothetical protein
VAVSDTSIAAVHAAAAVELPAKEETMIKTLPELKLVANVSMSIGLSEYVHRSMLRVVWEDADFCYHVNLMNDGSMPLPEPDEKRIHRSDIIHRNAKDESVKYPKSHTALDLYAARYEAIRDAILALVTPESVEAAYVEQEAIERAKIEAERKADSDKLRAAMAHEMDRLRLEGKGQQAHAIETAFAELDDAQVRRLANIIRSA